VGVRSNLVDSICEAQRTVAKKWLGSELGSNFYFLFINKKDKGPEGQ